MLTGGDEMYRTQYGNNNAYNLDSPKNWLDHGNLSTFGNFADFARRIMTFRGDHPALRPAQFFRGADNNGNGLKDITWYRDNGGEADGAYMDNPSMHFIAYRLDGTEAGDRATSIYVAYNSWSGPVTATLPRPTAGKSWYRVADTAAWWEGAGNAADPGQEALMGGATYTLAARSVLVLIER
jgi:glycogen operon protein